MSDYRFMDPEKIHQLIDGEPNLLAPMVEKEESFFRNVSCPSCGGQSHEPFINAKRPFSPGAVLPNRLLRCLSCTSEFDPYTRVIVKAGEIRLPARDE